MSFEFFEQEDGQGIIGYGKTVEEAFEEAAKATFSIMVDLDKVNPEKTVKIECSAESDETLLVEWLNKLLSEAELNDMVFSEFKITLMESLHIHGYAKGEKLNKKRHNFKREVKSATYEFLEVGKTGRKFLVKCIMDV